jgi:hypothetical protein
MTAERHHQENRDLSEKHQALAVEVEVAAAQISKALVEIPSAVSGVETSV